MNYSRIVTSFAGVAYLVVLLFLSGCGKSPDEQLLAAVKSGDAVLAKQALANKADPDGRLDDSDDPFLHKAVKDGRLALAELLLKAGAKPNQLDRLGYSALKYAIANKNLDMIRLLIEQGASPDALWRDGRTALLLAINQNDLAVLQLLLATKLPCQQTFGDNKKTYLMIAAENNQGEVAELLLKSGKCDIRDKDTKGKMPFQYVKDKNIAALLTPPGLAPKPKPKPKPKAIELVAELRKDRIVFKGRNYAYSNATDFIRDVLEAKYNVSPEPVLMLKIVEPVNQHNFKQVMSRQDALGECQLINWHMVRP